MNIVDPIFFHCRYQPEAMAICAPGVDLVTYSRLEYCTNNIARRAVSAGLSHEHVVAISVRQPVFHAALILALARLGIATASIGARKLIRDLHFDAVLSDGAEVIPTTTKTMPVDPSWMAGDGKPVPIDREIRGSDLCRILLTSGSTGEVKGVPLTHDMVVGRILRYAATHGRRLGLSSRIFCDMTWGTAIGYQFLIYTLCKGGTYFVRGNSAENTLRALEFYNVDTLVAAPSGLAELLADFEKFRCQHTVNAILTAGSLISKSLAERVRARISPNLISDYGAAETGCAAIADMWTIERFPASVGYVVPGMTIEIVDDQERPIPHEGQVRIRGDYVANGYFRDQETSARFFRGGWFYPGDIGSLTTDRMLIISGRQKTILNVGGDKIKPEAIEEVLTSFDGIIQAAALTAIGQSGLEEVWAVIRPLKQIDEQLLRAHCEQRLVGIFVPRRFIVMEALPTNEAGKLDRERLAQLLTTGGPDATWIDSTFPRGRSKRPY